MRAGLLHVLCALSNPILWHSRVNLFRRFAHHMLESGVQLTVVECALGERPFVGEIEGAQHIGVRAKTVVWCKENLLNIGLSRLPTNWNYVAWIDADVRFRNPCWAAETVHALQQYQFVQPWEFCLDLGPQDQILAVHNSFASRWAKKRPINPKGQAGYTFPHPGYAWAATRQALEYVGGLVDTGVLGAGDHHMALALIGRAVESFPGLISEGYKRPILQWQERAERHITRNIGFVHGSTIEHFWHGPKPGRNYVGRWDLLVQNKFDPTTDLKRNTHGVYELAGNKPDLRRDIDNYFRNREEDSSSLSWT